MADVKEKAKHCTGSAPRTDTVEVMDTTLLDCEQMQDGSYTPEEKLTLARLLLEDVRVDRRSISGFSQFSCADRIGSNFMRKLFRRCNNFKSGSGREPL